MARNPERQTVLERGLCLAVALVVALSARAWAQQGRKTARIDEDLSSENVFLPADRRTLQKLSDARKLLAEGRYGEAVRYLGAILDGPEDFFVGPEKGEASARSLKAEAQRLIGQMPREGRDLYELQYGAQARKMLDEAMQAGDSTGLAEVSRRFFHTRGGYQATFLLGLNHFDRGRPLAGALALERLREAGDCAEEFEPALSLTAAACWLQAGMAQKARDTLVSLRQAHPKLSVTVAGRQTPIFNGDSEAFDWLAGLVGSRGSTVAAGPDGWLLFRGDAARNAAAPGGAPLLNLRWRVAVTDDPVIEAALAQRGRQYADDGTPTISALHPLAVGEVLLMRTAASLVAVDFSTGKRIWAAPEGDAGELPSGAPPMDLRVRQSAMISGIGQRLWGDLTYGTLSSDGRSVFAVEDQELGFGPGGVLGVQFGRVVGRNVVLGRAAGDEQAALCNRLAAYEVGTGKLKWHIGGAAGPNQNALPPAETFFLGPPLPLMGQLYALAETKGEIRLLALEGATGKVLWSQQLAVAEQSILQDPLRRWAGASPSYADGVLVCPTAAGAIVGVDLTTRSLLWGYRYGRGDGRNRPQMAVSMSAGGQSPSRWIDGGVSIADGRALATPVESDFLHCLGLPDGKLFWKCPRQDDLYVACADRERVVLVGRRSVRAVRTADGKPAWDGRTVDLPDQSTPSGRGFQSNGRYFLPLSSAEVVAIDLGAGKIVQVAKSPKEDVPGNLVCHRGKVISQASAGVDAYYILDAAAAEAQRRLAANPNDAAALALSGETLLEAGKRSEAVASLGRAYELEGDPRTRQLLRDSLLDGLRTDFAAYRQRSAEVERLIDDDAEQAVYLRLMAEGSRRAGQWEAAFEYYQKLIDQQPNGRPLDQLDKTLTVRRDRWLPVQLALLRNEARDESAARIDAAVKTRLDAALATGAVEPLRLLVDYFGDHPAAAAARSELVRRLKSSGRLLEAELCETASGRQQLSDSRTREDLVGRQKERDASWPVGAVEIAGRITKNLPDNGYRRHAIEIRGSAAPFYCDASIRFDDARQTIVGSDGLGRQQWQVSLAAEGQRPNFFYNRAWTYARTKGHLLLVVLGWRIAAIDTLGSGRDGSARLLWTQDMLGQNADPVGPRLLPAALANLPLQWPNQFALSYDRSGLLGPVTDRYVCFQRFRSVVAVDPRNGETLWVRQNVPPGSELFGDDQCVFVVSPDREEAALLRAADGELLGTRKVPRPGGHRRVQDGEEKTVFARLEESCVAVLGRRLLVWRPEGGDRVLSLFDPLDGREVRLGRGFSATARTCVVGEEAVGVMEPGGRFALVGLPDGRTIAEAQLEAEPALIDITLLADGDRYFLITHSAPSGGSRPASIQPMPGGASKPIYRGRLYALDGEGRLLWPAPAAIKDQFLLLDQPARLPILSFACQAYRQKPKGENRQTMSLLCIDKRNGRTAYKKEFVNHAGILDIVGDLQRKTVDLVMQRDTVTLSFTDKPLPPPSATDGEPAKPPQETNPARIFWKSMFKKLDRLLDGDDEEEED